MFIYALSVFLTSTAFVDTKAKIRHIPFEIYRIFKNCPLGYDPNVRLFFCFRDAREVVPYGGFYYIP